MKKKPKKDREEIGRSLARLVSYDRMLRIWRGIQRDAERGGRGWR
ncbi:MAG: hypothetical protein OCU12_07130 [Methanophagales archaeon]|nr:hypothetical protein [Methanophagales archaeon]